MRQSNIYILSGSVKSGKTTELMNLIKARENISGILQPVIDGKRYVYFIDTGEKMQLELEAGSSKNFIKIGQYKFDLAAMEWAKGSLIFADSLDNKILIIDEFGKLELKGIGLEPVISDIINASKNSQLKKIVLVVRDYLVENAIDHLNLKPSEYKIISVIELKSLLNQL